MILLEVKRLLKLDYPMLMLDGVTECEADKFCMAYKNLTYNEWFFPGHYKSSPIFPGSLQIEALTQAFSLPLLITRHTADQPVPTLLASVDKARFYKTVVPGDRFEIECVIERVAMGLASGAAMAFVAGEKVSECRITSKPIQRKEGVNYGK
jgi:3-hydroxyacyl-[acyl-carrier-protein] dehydratase